MLKTIKNFLAGCLLAGTTIYGAIIAPELHNHYLRWEVGESVVQVLSMTSNGGGTGFAVQGASGKKYIMTNRHVCEAQANGTIRVRISEGYTIYRRVIYMDRVHDLCLIEGVSDLSPLSIGSDQNKGDLMYVVGHPGLRELTTSIGEYIGRKSIPLLYNVERREDCPGKIYELSPLQQLFMGRDFACVREYPSLATSAVIYGGNSGSPVVNKWGNLIGVAFAGSTEQERDNYVVPLYYVKRLLNRF